MNVSLESISSREFISNYIQRVIVNKTCLESFQNLISQYISEIGTIDTGKRVTVSSSEPFLNLKRLLVGISQEDIGLLEYDESILSEKLNKLVPLYEQGHLSLKQKKHLHSDYWMRVYVNYTEDETVTSYRNLDNFLDEIKRTLNSFSSFSIEDKVFSLQEFLETLDIGEEKNIYKFIANQFFFINYEPAQCFYSKNISIYSALLNLSASTLASEIPNESEGKKIYTLFFDGNTNAAEYFNNFDFDSSGVKSEYYRAYEKISSQFKQFLELLKSRTINYSS